MARVGLNIDTDNMFLLQDTRLGTGFVRFLPQQGVLAGGRGQKSSNRTEIEPSELSRTPWTAPPLPLHREHGETGMEAFVVHQDQQSGEENHQSHLQSFP